jgi:hypothetical protein
MRQRDGDDIRNALPRSAAEVSAKSAAAAELLDMKPTTHASKMKASGLFDSGLEAALGERCSITCSYRAFRPVSAPKRKTPAAFATGAFERFGCGGRIEPCGLQDDSAATGKPSTGKVERAWDFFLTLKPPAAWLRLRTTESWLS